MLKIFKLIKQTFEGFSNDNAFKLSASLSYYTLFSLAPMLLIFLSIVGFFMVKMRLEANYMDK